MLLGIFVLELFLLYFLSRWVTQKLFTFFFLFTNSRPVAITLLLLLEFPGTVVHELAHLFTAEILGVKTGKMRLEPESIRGTEIQSGSVMVAQSDPFRRYAIGIAPLTWGIILLTAIAYFIGGIPFDWKNLFTLSNWVYLGLGYLLFSVSNTMFPSSVDLKGFWPFAIAISLFLAAGWFLGLRFTLTGQALVTVTAIISTLTKSLGIVIGVNIVLLVVTSFVLHILKRVLKVRSIG